MKKILCIIFVLTICVLNAQVFQLVSSCEDSSGIKEDLGIISQKLGEPNDSLLNGLICLEIEYFGFDINGNLDSNIIRKGVLIVHKSAAEDLQHVFKELFLIKFPIHSIIPVNKFGLNIDSSGWNDGASMSANNTSAFNYRLITLSDDLSPHAFGTAVDINPLLNPYEKYLHDGKFTEPENAVYDVTRPGTISDGRVVGIFDQRGWVWGGRWNNPVDYQHFDLRKERSRKHYLMKDSGVKLFFSISESEDSMSLYSSKIDRKMERPILSVRKSEYKDLKKCIDSLGIKCPSYWNKGAFKNLVPDSASTSMNKIVEICIDEKSNFKQWNKHCAGLIVKKLKEMGINAFYGKMNNPKADLRISVEIGNNDFDLKEYFQIIYVPGAFKEKNLSSTTALMDFYNLLVSEDLPRSIDIAGKLQQSIENSLKIKAINRQVTGPNILQEDCIKTNFDGIYCRNHPSFSAHFCPQIMLSLLSVNQADEIFSAPKSGFLFCEHLSEAISKAILEYMIK